MLRSILPRRANYFRFNPLDVQDIQMDETDEVQLAVLRNRTQIYLDMPATRAKLDRCAAVLARRLDRSATS